MWPEIIRGSLGLKMEKATILGEIAVGVVPQVAILLGFWPRGQNVP
jgi:hypothetical protein